MSLRQNAAGVLSFWTGSRIVIIYGMGGMCAAGEDGYTGNEGHIGWLTTQVLETSGDGGPKCKLRMTVQDARALIDPMTAAKPETAKYEVVWTPTSQR